uniref:ADP-ribosylation factor-like protein 2-binding protein n=1 Tax=Globisporangium ultimum (strain ATCC 200006 / CBS 805.95 / DAOM BR144) TaxID=431595 RepID=K3X855_GLOUD
MSATASDEPEITDALKFEEEEIFSTDTGDNTEENQFDEMIGALQDILIDPEFVALQSDFCFRNCEVFENVTENKLIYTSIFNEYANLIESFLEQRLLEKLEYFSMDELVRQMQEHEDEIPLDVIDVLQSCFDFEEFKSLMLSFKQNETPNIEITGDALVVCGSE